MRLNSSSPGLATAKPAVVGRAYKPHAVAAVPLCLIQRHQVTSRGRWVLIYVAGQVGVQHPLIKRLAHFTQVSTAMDPSAKMGAESKSCCDDICQDGCRRQDPLERRAKAWLTAVAEHVWFAKGSA